MFLSQKCQYALRAVFEIAKRWENGTITIHEISERQAIPSSFLAIILGQLRRSGFVISKRGADGGYRLAYPPNQISLGDIIRYVDGPVGPTRCVVDNSGEDCPLREGCVFMPVWIRAQRALEDVFDGTTLQDLLDEEARIQRDPKEIQMCYVI